MNNKDIIAEISSHLPIEDKVAFKSSHKLANNSIELTNQDKKLLKIDRARKAILDLKGYVDEETVKETFVTLLINLYIHEEVTIQQVIQDLEQNNCIGYLGLILNSYAKKIFDANKHKTRIATDIRYCLKYLAKNYKIKSNLIRTYVVMCINYILKTDSIAMGDAERMLLEHIDKDKIETMTDINNKIDWIRGWL